jgi:hypothetical protein
MEISEKHTIIIEKYPYYKSLNERLLKDANSIDYPKSYTTNVKGRMSEWLIYTENTIIVESWILNILTVKYPLINNYNKSVNIFTSDMFFVRYGKGDVTLSHNHFPSVWSWIYYIKCPKGSAPLVFTNSGKKISVEEGTVVIFPSFIPHHVPKNKCDDRVALIGNINIEDTAGRIKNENIRNAFTLSHNLKGLDATESRG